MTRLSEELIKQELNQVKEQVRFITGQQNMKYLRPPRGIFNERVLEESKNLGYTTVFWSIAYKDWDVKTQKGASYAFQQVTKQFHPGAILLLHSVSKDNAEALGAIIDEARKQGYTFKGLNDISSGNRHEGMN